MKPVLLFVINSIGHGGAERVLSNILSARTAEAACYDLHLAVLDDLPDARPIPSGVTVHRLDARQSMVRSILQLRMLVARLRPAAIISLLIRSNVASAIAGYVHNVPTILCERMNISSHLAGKHSGLKLMAARALSRLGYRLATRILGVSEGVSEDLISALHADPAKVETIHNPYDLPAIVAAGREMPEYTPLPARFAVAVARLEHAKNIDGLIDAYVEAAPGFPLIILGQGSQEDHLRAHVTSIGARDGILFAGYQANPFALMSRAAFYVSASLNEGFPNAMVEAMALSIPIVATDCPSGPAEILGAQAEMAGRATAAPYGLIVPMRDKAAMVDGIQRLLDPDIHAHYAVRGATRAGAFDLNIVADRYWKLFDKIARRAN